MDVLDKLIDDICKIMNVNVKDKESMFLAINNCKANGIITTQELLHLTSLGLPIIQVYSKILRLSVQDGYDKIKKENMSFLDLSCVIAIFAQDLMFRQQQARNKYIFIT